MKKVILRIKRQNTPVSRPYWHTFEVTVKTGSNVISALQEIRLNPITVENKKVNPPVWECNCLEEVCGACSMLINGKPRQACSALIDQLSSPITLEPLSKFPVIRDLMVDRISMFKSLMKVKGWIDIDGSFDMGRGPKISPKKQNFMYTLSTCMTCGCCVESCPQVNKRSPYIGPYALAQAVLFNSHPTGKMIKHKRVNAVMKNDGIANCGNAQNCEKVCPKKIPLVTALSKLQRDVVVSGILGKLSE